MEETNSNSRNVNGRRWRWILMTNVEWIPVSEELPKDPSPVLVTILWHEPYDNYEVSIEEYWENGDGWGDWGNAEIVAWMPLPEPHKQDGEA